MIHIEFDEAKLSALVKNAVNEAMAEILNRSEPPAPERKILHSIRDLSEFIGCSTVTAQRLKNEGRIPYRQIGRKVMFDTAEVLKAMEQGKKRR